MATAEAAPTASKTDFEQIREKTTQESLQELMKGASVDKVGDTLNNSQKTKEETEKLLSDAKRKEFEQALQKTNVPSEGIKNLLSDPNKLAELAKQPPEKLQEQFKTLNKGDIIALSAALNKLPAGSENLKALKTGLATVIDTMIANGFSIESKTDIEFLEKNGGDKVKELIKKQKEVGGALEKYDGTTQLILQSKGDAPSLQPAIKDGKLIEGLDITKLNTINTKADAKQIEDKLKASGINMADMKKNFSEAINNLMNSSNPMLKGLGELFKFFGKLFGFGSEGNAESKTEKLDAKGQKKLLESMGKNDKYKVSDFFDKGGIKNGIDTKSEGFQQYMRDTYTLLGKELPKDPKQILEYNDKLKDEVKAYEKSIDGKEGSGLLTQARIEELFKKLNGADKGKEGDKKDETPSEKPVEKHKLSDLVEKIKKHGNFKGIKNDIGLVKEIQRALNVADDGKYGKKTIMAVKGFQQEIGMGPNADGKIGPKTIQKMEEWNKEHQKPVAAPSPEIKK